MNLNLNVIMCISYIRVCYNVDSINPYLTMLIMKSRQIPAFLSSRREFANSSRENASSKLGSTGKPPDNENQRLGKQILTGVALGAVITAAYYSGFIDFISRPVVGPLKEDKIGVDTRYVIRNGELVVSHESEESSKLSPAAEEKSETHSDIPSVEPLSERQGENQSRVEDKPDITPVQEKEVPEYAQLRAESSDQSTESGVSSKESTDIKSTEEDTSKTPNEIHTAPVSTQDGAVLQESDTETLPPQHISIEIIPEVRCLTLLNKLHAIVMFYL